MEICCILDGQNPFTKALAELGFRKGSRENQIDKESGTICHNKAEQQPIKAMPIRSCDEKKDGKEVTTDIEPDELGNKWDPLIKKGRNVASGQA